MSKKHQILFVVFNEIDPFAGGVQNIVSVLNDIFKNDGHSVQFLLLNHSSKTSGDIHYFKIDESEILKDKCNQRLLDFLELNKFDFIINNHGVNYYKFIDKIKSYNNYLEHKFKLINYHHNAIEDIFVNYENITLNKFKNSNSFLNKWISICFYNIVIFKLIYLLIGKIKLWYSFIRAIKYGDANVFYFESFKNEAQNLFLSSKNVEYVNILPPIRYSFNHNSHFRKENIILFVGRVELMQKRFDRVLSIWKDCSKDLTDWKLVVVGEGDYLETAKEYVRENQLINLEFVGKADPKEYFLKSKLFILTSDFEGLGLVLVEALAHGCVPIAFNCYTGIQRIILNDVNGIVVPKDNQVEFIQKIFEVANKNDYFLDLQKNSRLIESDFLTENIVLQWNNLFMKLNNE